MTSDSRAGRAEMSRTVILVGVVTTAVALALFLGGCGGGAAPDVEAGGRIYSAQCARCHGGAGEGGVGPSLLGIGRVFETSEGQERFVKTGGVGMPTFDQILTDEEVRDVVAYTRDSFG